MTGTKSKSNGLLDFIIASRNSDKPILSRESSKPCIGNLLNLEKADNNELPSKTELHAAADSSECS
jgi:hypothetical protein